MIYATDFPAVGHKYHLVDFQQFKVMLDFTSITSMTFTGLRLTAVPGTRRRLRLMLSRSVMVFFW